MQKSAIPEMNLKNNAEQKNIQFYHWPYSQPRIVNTIKAASRMGYVTGLFSSLMMLNDFYTENSIIFIDMCLLIGLLILNIGIVPAIRRNQIKYTASESRTINKYGLIFLSIAMHSALIRFGLASILYLVNNKFDIVSFGKLIISTIGMTEIFVATAFMLIGPILLLFPKDVNVYNYHYKLLDAKRNTYSFEPQTETYRAPRGVTNYGTTEFSSTQPIETPKPKKKVEHKNNNKTNKPVQNRPTQNKPATKPAEIKFSAQPQTKKDTPKESIWDAQKSSRKPRR